MILYTTNLMLYSNYTALYIIHYMYDTVLCYAIVHCIVHVLYTHVVHRPTVYYYTMLFILLYILVVYAVQYAILYYRKYL